MVKEWAEVESGHSDARTLSLGTKVPLCVMLQSPIFRQHCSHSFERKIILLQKLPILIKLMPVQQKNLRMNFIPLTASCWPGGGNLATLLGPVSRILMKPNLLNLDLNLTYISFKWKYKYRVVCFFFFNQHLVQTKKNQISSKLNLN